MWDFDLLKLMNMMTRRDSDWTNLQRMKSDIKVEFSLSLLETITVVKLTVPGPDTWIWNDPVKGPSRVVANRTYLYDACRVEVIRKL